MPSAGGPAGTAGTCTGAPGSAGWLPIRVTLRWLSASSGCSSTLCRQVLGSACTGPTAIAPPSPRSPRGSLQARRHMLCCGRQAPLGPRKQLPQPVPSLRPPHGFSSPARFCVFRSARRGQADPLCVPGTRPGTAGRERVERSCVWGEEAGGVLGHPTGGRGRSQHRARGETVPASGSLVAVGLCGRSASVGTAGLGCGLLLPQGCPSARSGPVPAGAGRPGLRGPLHQGQAAGTLPLDPQSRGPLGLPTGSPQLPPSAPQVSFLPGLLHSFQVRVSQTGPSNSPPSPGPLLEASA